MLETLMQSDAVTRLGMALLHFVWQGFAIGALLALCLAVLGPQANRARYAVAVGTLILLAASPAVTWWVMPSSSPAVVETANEVPTERQESDPAGVQPVVSGGVGGVIDPSAPPEKFSVWKGVRAWISHLGEPVTRLAPWLALFWTIGVAASSSKLIGGFITLRCRRLASGFASGNLQRRCAALATRMGITAPVELRVSSRIDSPCTFGLFRPVILLPVSVATGLSVDRLELILAHELAHIQRHDYAVNLLQAVVETLLFYHPAVWWVSRVVRLEREHICDSLALEATGGNRVEYVQTLLSLEEARASLSLAASEAPLLDRARRILGAPVGSRTSFPTLLAPIMSYGLLVTLATGLVLAQSSEPEHAVGAIDPIAELTERFDVSIEQFVWATVVGDVQWREDVEGLGPNRWRTFADDAFVVLEERRKGFTRQVRVSQVNGEIEYLYTTPRDEEEPSQAELLAWIQQMLQQASDPEREGTWGSSTDTAVISVVRGEDLADLREQVLYHAGTLSFNPWLASQAMQLHSADLVDDAFVAEVVRTGIATLEKRMPSEPEARGLRIEHHVPWMLLTAYAVESDELRLDLLADIAHFATHPSGEAAGVRPFPVYDAEGRIIGWDAASD